MEYTLKKYEEIMRAFTDYAKEHLTEFSDFKYVQRVLYFPSYGCDVLTIGTVIRSDLPRDVGEKKTLEHWLKKFPEYTYNESELVIQLDDSSKELVDAYGCRFEENIYWYDEEEMNEELNEHGFITNPANLFAMIFNDLLNMPFLDESYEKRLHALEKMRQEVWKKVFENLPLPEKLGYDREGN